MDELSKGTDDFKGLCCRGLRKGEELSAIHSIILSYLHRKTCEFGGD